MNTVCENSVQIRCLHARYYSQIFTTMKTTIGINFILYKEILYTWSHGVYKKPFLLKDTEGMIYCMELCGVIITLRVFVQILYFLRRTFRDSALSLPASKVLLIYQWILLLLPDWLTFKAQACKLATCTHGLQGMQSQTHSCSTAFKILTKGNIYEGL